LGFIPKRRSNFIKKYKSTPI